MNIPVFRSRYGGSIQWHDGKRHLADTAVNHGYHHIVAWHILLGSNAYYIIDRCTEAKAAGAPNDVFSFDTIDRFKPTEHKSWKHWSTFGGTGQVREIVEYIVAELDRHTRALAAHRAAMKRAGR
ncbi:hypothetical protein [Streptomyces albipurpureus]|uniref:Uncharacterized protein n=1 Tax=Streptomyces albipurpureus TaxID=2897419 RepID=A0ABT0UVJ6_9ACTN|nr:hypothetical protein [Streptomyces sp. CWNU-1]MCM2392614.1 hypothetical protein [Streptomyces sp. CWNU-1]